jgi:8-hydroxy-5-deazaflavin:NADPH oxidoreductase
MAKKIGVIGSGAVGVVLANGFAKHGFEVLLGTNTPAKRDELKGKVMGNMKVGSFADAAKFGELLVFATKGSAAEAALAIAGPAHMAGKTVIDTTNPIADLPPVNGVIQYTTSANQSLMERLQKLAPAAHFVKAFSCVGNASMVDPDFDGMKPTMFICGNDDKAKREVTGVLNTFGWETEDMGKIEAARAIEPLAMLWCIPGFLGKGWSHAFRLLKK